MSEDPITAIDEVIFRVDEAVGKDNGVCSGWLKRAPMDEVLNWLGNNIRARLVNARHQAIELRNATKSLCHEVGDKLVSCPGEGNKIEGDAGRIIVALNKAREIVGDD